MTESKHEDSLRASVSRPGPPSETTKHLAYAEAAFLLIECLMLVFIERGLFTGLAISQRALKLRHP